jgi:hypothetical protein
VDCIFMDPPYNTGNEGWAYNDNVNSPLDRPAGGVPQRARYGAARDATTRAAGASWIMMPISCPRSTGGRWPIREQTLYR